MLPSLSIFLALGYVTFSLNILTMMPWLWKRISRKGRLNNSKVHVAMAREKAYGKAWFGLDRLKQLQVQEKVGWTTQRYKNPSAKPYFSWSVHSTFLISCYLKSHAYIFFDSINLKYFMFGSVLFRLQIFYVVSVLLCSDAMNPFIASSIWMISSPS